MDDNPFAPPKQHIVSEITWSTLDQDLTRQRSSAIFWCCLLIPMTYFVGYRFVHDLSSNPLLGIDRRFENKQTWFVIGVATLLGMATLLSEFVGYMEFWKSWLVGDWVPNWVRRGREQIAFKVFAKGTFDEQLVCLARMRSVSGVLLIYNALNLNLMCYSVFGARFSLLLAVFLSIQVVLRFPTKKRLIRSMENKWRMYQQIYTDMTGSMK